MISKNVNAMISETHFRSGRLATCFFTRAIFTSFRPGGNQRGASWVWQPPCTLRRSSVSGAGVELSIADVEPGAASPSAVESKGMRWHGANLIRNRKWLHSIALFCVILIVIDNWSKCISVSVVFIDHPFHNRNHGCFYSYKVKCITEE